MLNEITSREKTVIKVLQEEFPICEEPYKKLAIQAGMTEKEFINCVQMLASEKKIRKIGAVLRHREAGFVANALCAWNVPANELDKVVKFMIKKPAVSHCYDRTTAPNWNYNLYTMIHAKSRSECDKIITELSEVTGIKDYQIFYSKKEWKKTSMKYFCE